MFETQLIEQDHLNKLASRKDALASPNDFQLFGSNSRDLKPFQFVFLLFFFVAAQKKTLDSGLNMSAPSVDCVMGGWSEWSACSKNNGTRTRSRDVIQQPMHNGIPCSNLKETNNCPGAN